MNLDFAYRFVIDKYNIEFNVSRYKNIKFDYK